ncbi:MAG: T9SS type A sorting domain-containing protein [Melioribacteraceae bacterium]
MRNRIFLFLTFLITTTIYCQSPVSKTGSLLWGDDIVVDDYTNTGKFDCIQAYDGKLYIAIIDNTTTWTTITYLVSSDRGATWVPLPFVQEDREIIKNVKLVSTHNAIFSFYQTADTLKIFNITQTYSNNYFRFPYSLMTWDVEYCSYNQNFYLLYDRGTLSEYLHMQIISPTNDMIKLGHSYNIMEWGNNPQISIYQNKIAMCFYVGRSEPISNREVHYSLGTVNTEGGFTNSLPQEIIPNAPIKSEIDIAIIQSKVYLLFVEHTGASLDIRGVVSLDDGKNFSPVFDVSSELSKNEQWIDLSNEGEFNLAYFEEEIQPGEPTNETNKIVFKFDQDISGTSQFSIPTYASSHPPVWAMHEPKPRLVPIITQGSYDCGIVWAGKSSSEYKIYLNRFLDLTDVQKSASLPTIPNLSQNYPNPFNPTTTINYQLATAEYITLKVYDVLGREVAVLVNDFQNRGLYSIKMNSKYYNLGSGMYFYQIKAGAYSDTKKMLLLK